MQKILKAGSIISLGDTNFTISEDTFIEGEENFFQFLAVFPGGWFGENNFRYDLDNLDGTPLYRWKENLRDDKESVKSGYE